MTRTSSMSVQIGSVSGSVFAVGDKATVINSQVVSAGDDDESGDE